MPVKIKICCIASIEEAMMAINAGANAVGLVARMPSGPGPISDESIAAITPHITKEIASFLLTSEQSAAEIIAHIQRTGANTVQIVDELTAGTYDQIREAMPSVSIVQVIHVTGEESIEQAIGIQDQVDYILLDSGNPKAAVKTLGGTGNTHNWEISRELVSRVSKPVFLAGGLNADNVQQAIEMVKPYGVDICNGVRTEGKLDRVKLQAFISAVSG
ncbi:phosphoribosylanthranilate isomerase [Terrimonas sp. NA20]|uniref:N-(5'-phosphoribosyl)anthranilate isomerase n=1 Tax=Terrimonas ginsenosidimutans TaxID=2908004 RepID=A0ABS9KYY9_9BACT|nr:phosphoribosylanthranilate isomerase [Terrimonas ginsenosidimutans]MCG2617488.1 phosphoribosylanthranilate isomerase [Terrimonas ginsenosidimutans]